MRGHLRKRGGGWELRAYAGRDPMTGRKRYQTRTLRGVGKREAEKRLAAFVTEVGHGVATAGTFGELVERWYGVRVDAWSPKNAMETRRMIDGYLTPLMDVPLDKVRTASLDAFYADLRARGGKHGRPLAASSVARIHTIVRAALEQAVTWGWLAVNPAAKARPGAVEETEINPPAPDQLPAVFDAAERHSPDLAVFLLLAAVTGARRSELCALRWSDLAPGVVTVARGIVLGPLNDDTLSAYRGHIWEAGWQRGQRPTALIEKKTKTNRPRTIAVDEATAAVLAAQRARAAEGALAHGVSLPPDAFVFSHQPDGSRPWRPDTVSRTFTRLCRDCGLQGIRLHDLRHFVVTTLLGAGVDQRTVMGRAGHASLASLARYAHFVQANDQAAAELLARMLDRRAEHGQEVVSGGVPPAATVPRDGPRRG